MNSVQYSIESLPEYDNHIVVSTIFGRATELKAFIALHRKGKKHASFGATRMWSYASDVDALRDALRLAKLMSYKSAMAGLPYGGAKGIVFPPTHPNKRNLILKEYARHVNYLNGRFITGADAGVSQQDVKMMKKVSPFMVGVKSDPVEFTMLGVYYGIQICLQEVFGSDDLSNRTFAIQGLGKTGLELLKLIYPDAKKIYVTDINEKSISNARHLFPKIEVVSPTAIVSKRVDVFSPCALSHILNTETVPHIQASIVAGSANNQLASPEVGEMLYHHGVLYAPDYVINAGGLMTVVDEFEHKNHNRPRVEQKVASIQTTLKTILAKSKHMKKAPNIIADGMAESKIRLF
jgi:leucine dehydrogenase